MPFIVPWLPGANAVPGVGRHLFEKSYWPYEYMLAHIYGMPYIVKMQVNAINFLKQLADETRLRCLVLIERQGEICVCELTHALGLSQPKISRHLAGLRDAGIVQGRRDGQWIYYSLHSDMPRRARSILSAAVQAVDGLQPYAGDLSNLASMPDRPGAACCA